MIRYKQSNPGGDGFVSTIVRLWWTFIDYYHTYRCLIAQSVSSQRPLLPSNEKRSGETVVITGGSRGIGAAVVRKLLQCDMHVIIGCRDVFKTNEMVKSIRRSGVTAGTAHALPLDLSSFNSVKEFSYKVMKKDVQLTALINNAGVRDHSYGQTVEGLEQHFQINYLSPLLLTYMLLPKLHTSSSPERSGRVVNVSSLEHFGAYPDLNDSQMMRFYSPDKAYMDAKQMIITWNNFLDRKLQKVGVSVRSFAIHPGFVKTELWSQVGWVNKMGILHYLFFEKNEAAAEAIAYTALSPQLEGTGGLFLSNNQQIEPHSLCKDEKFQNALWEMSCKLLKMEQNALCPIHKEEEEEEEEDWDEGEAYMFNENQGHIDLDFEEEFHLNSSSTKPFSKKEQRQTQTSLVASWKHSFRLNLDFKILKYFSFVGNEEGAGGNVRRSKRRSKPYYEYFISSVFAHWNLNKSCLRYLETMSIFLLRRLDRFNSQFKLVQTFVRSD